MVAVDRICVAASICALLSIAPPVSCTALDSRCMGSDRATIVALCVVPCSRMAHPKKRTISASILLGYSYFWPSWFRSGLLVLIGVVQTVLAMHPAWAHLVERYSRCRDRSYLRDATESIAKTTKHLHTGHQTTSVNTYLSCATSFARAPPRFESTP